MSRISYEDEMQARGELDLNNLRPGDVIRLESGDLSELIEANPTDPSIVVTAPAGLHLDAESETQVMHPDEGVLLVHSGDPRIGNSRIVTVAAADLGC